MAVWKVRDVSFLSALIADLHLFLGRLLNKPEDM
jgi:hypothetical protein